MDATSVFLTVITILLAGNAYFIKRLIDKIDIAAEQAKSASIAVSEIKADIKELRRLEIDVAVMKSTMFPRYRPPLPPPDHDAMAKAG